MYDFYWILITNIASVNATLIIKYSNTNRKCLNH
ncbi:hypothetical protein M2137_002996 [Parabacteroides sp. PFB2-10]|nr:hypothetical protein [Parabacteroides sp. PFB2-10]